MLAMQVRDVELLDQGAIVTLAEVALEVRLRFYTTRVGGEAVLAALQQKQSKRPPIHVLLLDALKHFDVSVCRATLDELREGGLDAHLHLQSSDGKNVTVEALDCDVVTIATRASAPLEVSEQVVAALGFRRGQLIDVGGYHLSVHVKGSGGPTVVLESGFGGGYVTWSKIQDDIARFTTVCSYDRASIGWSESGTKPRTFRHSVQDLHALLERLALPVPYVLVGHSLGGLLIRLYVECYPTDVAGLVLVDSTHPDQRDRFLAMLPPESADEPPSVREFRKGLLSPALWSPYWDDAAICWEEVQGCRNLGDLPLAVITAAKRDNPLDLPMEVVAQRDQLRQDMQEDLARLSSRSTHRFAEQSGHMIPFDQPEIVIDTIREMVDAIRQA